MTNPIILWIAGVLGWDPGIIVMLTTVVVIFGYIFLFMFLAHLSVELVWGFRRADGLEKFILFFPMLIVCLVVFALEIIHTILLIWAGYQAMKSFRNWWHKGAR